LGGEHLADAATAALFQGGVGIDPVPAQPAREQPGDRGLAGAARPDEEDDHSASSLIVTGDRARLTTWYMRSTGGSLPVNRRAWAAACRTNRSTPVTTLQPRCLASLISSVCSGV